MSLTNRYFEAVSRLTDMLDARAGARGRPVGLGQWLQELSVPRPVWAASAAINLLGLALPLSVLVFYDRIIPKAALETLATLSILVGVVILFEFLLGSLRSALLGRITARFSSGATVDAVTRYLGNGREPKGSVNGTVERIDAVSRVADFYGGPSRLSLIDLPFAGIFLIVLMIVGGPVALVPVAILAIYAGLSAVRSRKLANAFGRRAEHDGKFVDFISETLGQIVTVKGLAMESLLTRRFERLQENDAAVTYDMLYLYDAETWLVNLLTAVTTGMVVAVGALFVIADHLTVGALAASTMLSGRIVQPAIRGMGLWSETEKTRVALDEIEPLFESEPAPIRKVDTEAHHAAAVTLRAATCSEEDRVIANGISLDIPAGSYCALRSADDDGAHILDLIAGRTSPSSGQILIGGFEATDRRRSNGPAVGYVPSRPVVFRGTILDNLTLFGRGPSVDVARETSRIVGLESSINLLRHGYDTPLGEGVSETLPAGILQQIAIVRAVALGPGLLLLDQPQSALDRRADAMVIRALQRLKGHMTLIAVSNRPSYLKAADAAFDLEGGSLTPIMFDTPSQDTERSRA